MPTTIVDIITKDIRFPTSRTLAGSDAVHKDPDYSAAYVILKTDHPAGLEGHGLTFTIGRGNDICCAAIQSLATLIKGKTLESFTADMGAFWRTLTNDSQFRWLGPEKGVIHLATGALVNAVWDLWARVEGKPLWRLICDLPSEEIVRCIDFRYLTDVLTPEEALQILKKQEATRNQRIQELLEKGYPAYNTSVGWMGYSDEKIRNLCREGIKEGWLYFKMKVGADLQDDIRRARIIREEIGYERKLMMDANQRWDVGYAIEHMKQLAQFKPWWIEEPTSPDDILGHATIARAVRPLGIGVATGEHCQNRVIFKQLLQANAIDFCQIDMCRLAGVNENLAVLLLAAKFSVPVCPHAGGVGLCEYVQHMSYVDFVCVSGTYEGRVLEYVSHLHEHFYEPTDVRNGRYFPPKQPGFSIQIKPESFAEYEYPDGRFWVEDRQRKIT